MMINQSAKKVLALPRSVKRLMAVGNDVLICVLSVWVAFYLRLGMEPSLDTQLLSVCAVSILLCVPVFIVSGLYRAIFRYNGLHAMLALARAMLIYGAAFASIFTVYGVQGVPRNVGLIQPIVMFCLVAASRATARVWLGGLYARSMRQSTLPKALIYGAGQAGRQLALAMSNSPEMRTVGYLDDDDRLHGHQLNGLPIFNPEDLTEVLAEVEATDVLLALPSIARQRRNAILERLKPVKIIDLARRMVALSGLSVRDEQHPHGDVAIEVTGMRPGEKLYEELLIGNNPVATQHPRIMKANEQFVPWRELEHKLDSLSIAVQANDAPVIRGLLQQVVTGYQPSGEVVDWVHLAMTAGSEGG